MKNFATIVDTSSNSEDWFVNLDEIVYAYIREGKLNVRFIDGRICWFNVADCQHIIEAIRKRSIPTVLPTRDIMHVQV